MSTISSIRSPSTDGTSPSLDIQGGPSSTAGETAAIDLSDASNVTNILFALQNAQQDGQASEQEAAIHAQANEIRLVMDRIREAAEQAREQAEKSSFWGDVASTAKVVAAVATVAAGVAGAIGSGGLSVVGALAVAGAIISVGAKPIVKELGGSDELAMGIELGGGALALGAGLYSSLATGAQAAAEGSKVTNSALQVLARQARVGCTLVGSAALGAQGYAVIRGGIAQSASLDAQAEGAEQRAHQRVSQQQLDELVTGLKELGKSFQRAKSALVDSQNEIANTNNMLAASLGR
jgi:hypothetical protein